MGTANTSTHKRREILQIASEAKIFISKEIKAQIDYLHKKVDKDEWSGILLLELDGTINDTDNLVAIAKEVFLCDIGNGTFTSYDNEEHYDALWEKYPEYDFMNDKRWDGKKNTKGPKMAQIHTHHNMGAYFSTTDLDDLDINCRAHGLYISLIVDFKGDYKCKGAFVTEIEQKSSIRPVDFKGQDLVMTNTVEKLVTFDFEVIMPELIGVDDHFQERYEKIKEDKNRAKLAAMAAKAVPNYHNRGVATGHGHNKGKKLTDSIPVRNLPNPVIDSGFIEEFVPGLGTVYTDNAGRQIQENGMPLTVLQQEMYDEWDQLTEV